MTSTARRLRTPAATSALLVAGVLLAVVSVLSLSIGVVPIPPADLLSPTPQQWQLLTVSRIPRLLAVLLAGAAMSVAGLIMQRITQNSFVSPSTSGTVEAAVLGVLMATLLLPGASLTAKMAVAIVTAVLGTLVFLQLLQHIRYQDPVVVALVGLMYGGVISAVTVFLAYQRDLLQLLEIWQTGSFSAVLAGQYEPLYLVLVVGALGYLFADRFTVVGMGREFATNLGVRYTAVLYTGLVVVSVMGAVVVVVVGAIPFLGLIVPNVVSLFLGDHIRRTLPATALAGAGFVLGCDVVGRTIRFPYEIPVATVAGVIGAGVFVWLILRAAQRTAP
ncbi:ABC transporter permease [Ornithinicoccus halotolerans]|uniref:ABC transporter permease n=1 Tax=Ornithinicoccus halotolerans TaxID=1748220 RepID=UPI001E4C7476|nr:iron chelate uptake ABC transporter family permease subunit [Ornithinicoccus halotolerans]